MELRHTPRMYNEDALAKGAVVEPAAEQAHYLLHVLRLKAGETVRLFNGRDGEWQATVATLSKKSVTLAAGEQTRAPVAEPDLWLCAAPIKKAHFDYMIEKATELGVACIQPVLTSRTQIREVNVGRCRAIAIEAAEQSERLSIPEICEPVTLDKLVAGWAERQLIVCAEWGNAKPVGEALRENFSASTSQSPSRLREGLGVGGELAHTGNLSNSETAPVSSPHRPPPAPPASGRGAPAAAAATAVLTGPEGGFTADELEKLRAVKQSLFIRLGPRILRADTAAIAALTCWQAQCGDWR